MGYKLLADLAVLIHFFWILFLIFGAIWGRRHTLIKVFHLTGLAFAFVFHLFSLTCPLTHVEIYFRSLAGHGAAYSGAFIIHYVDKLIYLAVPPLFLLAITIALCVLNVIVYFLLGHPPAGTRSPPPPAKPSEPPPLARRAP